MQLKPCIETALHHVLNGERAGATAAPAQGALSRPGRRFWYNYLNFNIFFAIKDAINNKFVYEFNNTSLRN